MQVYDLPTGMLTEKILQSIGNFVGVFIKSDPLNLNGMWKPYVRMRVTMDIGKALKRRMKLKREGGDWNWIHFKYERLSMFCFVCGLLGHSDRDCAVVYANADKTIERAYGVWLRAPNKNVKNHNIGARWLRNGQDGNSTWNSGGQKTEGNTESGTGEKGAGFMETDGVVTEIPGHEGAIRIKSRDQGDPVNKQNAEWTEGINIGGNEFEKEVVIMENKRRRVINGGITENQETEGELDNISNGSKNGSEAGAGLQARLDQ